VAVGDGAGDGEEVGIGLVVRLMGRDASRG
jgi:hypothetical protein